MQVSGDEAVDLLACLETQSLDRLPALIDQAIVQRLRADPGLALDRDCILLSVADAQGGTVYHLDLVPITADLRAAARA